MDKILILDYGSQYTQLIARRVREIGVYSELFAWDINPDNIREYNPKGIILSGGPESVHADGAPTIPDVVFELGVPVLGICYGMQAMSERFGGKVESSGKQEFGYAKVEVTAENPLFAETPATLDVWMSHGDKVTRMPADFELVAQTSSAPISGFANREKHYYGIQFHPEVTHTAHGKTLLSNFVVDICGAEADWTTGNIVDRLVEDVRQTVGNDKVLLGLSGGVDSSVVAVLLHKAIGDQLTCVFVDNGLLRLNEGDQVMETFAKNLGVNVIRVDAEDKFMSALKGLDDPEAKRKAIGHTFIEVFDEAASSLDGIKYLAQGTIYPDVIESAGAKTGKAHVIKSHHNVGGLPEDMALALLEPLRDLFKDEVREVGVALGLAPEMVYRHPFPGPGLGVRILGEVNRDFAETLRRADAIFIEALVEAGLYHDVSQAFAVFLPVKSVGVTGDGRRYAHVIALRAVKTIDFMTAEWARLPYELLDEVSRRIVNEISDVSRVVYDITGKPPGTIEWE
ncbi:MAG: glutamine-hydrolyzing GMP synthase [Gammaproteobacteria bacterium]|nr:glutamine-hydrolyzing GMP synthase [Gammaproteobacteria bacterium]